MANIFGQRQVRRWAQGGAARKAGGMLVLVLLVVIVGLLTTYARSHRAYEPFVDSPAAGWHMRGQIERYAAPDLYLKIDGAADTYLGFNAERLRFAIYAAEAAGGLVVEVYCYDMATVADARAAYAFEKPSDAVTVSVGDMAYQAGGTVFFVQGSSYVRLIPVQGDDRRSIMKLAQALGR